MVKLFTLYGLTEIYNGPDGAQMHMKLGQEREVMFTELINLTGKYCKRNNWKAVIKSM